MKHLYYILFYTFLLLPITNYANPIYVDPPIITVSDNTVCEGSTVSLTANGAGTITWYTNDTGTGNSIGTGNTLSVSPTITTTYYAKANNEISLGLTVTVYEKPNVTVEEPVQNACSGNAIAFNSTVSGGEGPYTYLWSFSDGGNATTADPSHAFNSTGCGTETFTATLVVTDANNCARTVSKNVTIKRKPQVELQDTNIFSAFSNCVNNPTLANPNYTLTVNNTSQNDSCISSYTLNWGDGITVTNLQLSDFPLTHTYTQLGAFQLIITAIGANGCNNSETYTVANQSNPAGSLGTLGSTTGLCAPAIVPFTIGNWELNSPGTQYILNYGDGTSETFNHPLTSSTINHTYLTSSCPQPSFTATLTVVNSCDSTPYTAGNIQIRIKPEAQFTGPAAGCVNQSICFTNNTIVGSSGTNCSALTMYQWNFGDPTSPTNIINANGINTPNACHTFTAPGTYTVTLITSNPCGTDVFTKTICIGNPITSAFTIPTTTGCAPFAAQATNNTPLTATCNGTYEWMISYIGQNGNCGTAPASGFNYFTNGTTSTSANPSFNFPNPGNYTITLKVNSTCVNIQYSQTITVKAPPTVTINTISNVCGGTSAAINPVANITNCGSSTDTYLWTFPGGSPATSTNLNPGQVSYTTSGNHNVTLAVTNSCGTATDTKTFIITPAVVANSGADVTLCTGTSTQLAGTASGGSGSGYQYVWSPSAGLSNPNIANPIANPTATTTYTLNVTNNNCVSTDQVTVYRNTVNPGIIANNQSVCNGGDPALLTVATAATGQGTITYQWESTIQNSTIGYTAIDGAISATYDPPPTTIQTWYRRRVMSTLNNISCEAIGNFIEININAITSGTIAGDQTVCTGGNPAAFTVNITATASGNISYQWQSSTDAITFTNISGATAATYDAPAVNQTTYYKRIAKSTFNSTQCTQESNVVTVTVIALPVIITQPLPSQTVCQGATAATLEVGAQGGTGTIDYQWYVSNNSDGGNGTLISGATQAAYPPITTLTGTKYYYCVISQQAPGCSVTSSIAQVQVIAAPAISTQPVSSTVCLNGTVAPLSIAYTNGTGTPSYQWYINTTSTNTGGTAILNATSATHQPLATNEGINYYYAVITFPSGGCSSITSSVVAITVSPLPQITTQPIPEQNICTGGTVSALTVAGSSTSGTATYQWYSNTVNSITGGTAILGATSASYTPGAYNTTGTRYYYAVIAYSNSGCGTVTSDVAKVNVVADPVITVQPAGTQTLCQSPEASQLSVTASGGTGALSYQWYSNAANNTTGGSIINGATNATYTPPANTVGTVYYYCVIATPASGCLVTSTTSAVIVISAPFVSTQPQPQTLCAGTVPAMLTTGYTNGTGTPAYQWFTNNTNSTTGGSFINGATNASYQPSGDAAGTIYYYVRITFATGGCSVITSNAVAVTVNPLPVVTTVQQQTICSGSAFTITPQDGNGNSLPTGTQYKWSMPAGSGFTGGSAQNTPQDVISQTLNNTTNTLVTATYTVTPVANGCNGATFTVTVTVSPKPYVTVQTTTVCSEESFTITPANGSGNIIPAGTTYNWSTPIVSGLTGEVAGNTMPSIAGSLTNTTNTNQTATYTVTPIWTQGSNTCTGETFTVTVTVKPKPAVTSITQTVCSGTAFTITPVNATNGIVPAGTLYSWVAPAAQPGVSGLVAGNNNTAISGTINNSNITAVTVEYTVTPTANGCAGVPFTVTITIEPTPTVSAITSQVVCNASQTAPVTFTGTITNTIFEWVNSTPSVGLAASSTGDIAAFVATNNTSNPVTATITVTPKVNNCAGTPQTFTITVNPAPTVAFSQNNQTVCSNTVTAAVSLTSTTQSAAITWTANIPTGITGAVANGTTTIPSQTLINNTSLPLTITYTATAATTGGSTCPGAPSVYTIIVTPVPFVNGTQQTNTCSDIALNYIPDNSNGNNMPNGVTFTWAAPAGTGFTGGLVQNTPQTSLNQTLVNTTNATVTATYTITPHFNGCTGVPFTVAVTINPAAVIPNAVQTICNNGTFTFNPTTTATIMPAGTVYNWASPAGNITGGMAGSGQSVVTGMLTNTTAIPQTAIYTITPVSPQGNCNGAPFTLTVTVNPQFTVSAVVSNFNGFQISSAGANDGAVNITPTGGTGTYTYNWTGPNGFTASSQDVANLGPGTYNVAVNDGLCSAFTQSFVITEPLALVIAEVIASHVNVNCYGQATGVIEVAVTQSSIAPYDYAILLQNGTVMENALDVTALNYIFDNLPAGTYTIRVTDDNGTIKFINNIQITQPAIGLAISSAVVSNFNGFSISCFGAQNGSVNITVSGGYPGYTYSWTGPNGFTAATEDINNLNPGTYTVTIYDITNACPVTQSYTITEPQPVIFTGTMPNYNGYQVSCFNGTNGSINIVPTGGTGTYSYAWTGPNGFTAASQNLSNLMQGTYQLTLTDSNGCTAPVQSFTLTPPAALAITETHVNVLCFGQATGAIDVTVTGGVVNGLGTYTYAWTGPNGYMASSEDLTAITAGVYNLTATDVNGCNIALSVTIIQQPEIIIIPTTTPITCYGANDASITLTINGGHAPYTVQWDNLATGIFQDNLAAGTYTITVTDESNCVKIINVVIPEAPVFKVEPVVTQISCHGANDGSIILNLTGGIAPVNLVWSDGSTAGTQRNNLPPGTYTATLTDGKPCQIVRTFVIIEPAALTISANLTHALECNNAMTGAINTVVAGGTPPYTYAWSNGAGTENLSGITSGTYSVTVTDARGCTASGTYSITRPEPIILTVSSETDFNCDKHTVKQTNIARASGGLPPFEYTWSAGTASGQFGQYMNTTQNGTVIVTATDASGCTATATIDIKTEQLGEAMFSAGSYAYTTYQIYSIQDAIQFNNMSGGDYSEVGWNFGDGASSNELDPSHSYEREGKYTVILHVVYPYGCTDTFQMTIEVTKGYEVMIPNAFTPNDDGMNDTFNAVHKGLKSIELDVFDTWGTLVYAEKGEVIKGWNGYIKGNASENGNFYYRVKAETFYGEIVEYNGPFVLIK